SPHREGTRLSSRDTESRDIADELEQHSRDAPACAENLALIANLKIRADSRASENDEHEAGSNQSKLPAVVKQQQEAENRKDSGKYGVDGGTGENTQNVADARAAVCQISRCITPKKWHGQSQ